MSKELIRFPITDSNSDMFIEGNLVIPKRNQLVSEALNKITIATLLFDLLSDQEQHFDTQVEKIRSKIPGAILNKFNISLLTKRL